MWFHTSRCGPRNRHAVSVRYDGSFPPTTSCRSWRSTTRTPSPANAVGCCDARTVSVAHLRLAASAPRSHSRGDRRTLPSEGGRGIPSRSEVQRLRAENERLKLKLAKAETIIEVQEKCKRSWKSSPRARTPTRRRQHHRHRRRDPRGSVDLASQSLQDTGPIPCQPLPPPHPTAARATDPTTSFALGVERHTSRRDPRRVELRTVLRPSPRPNLGHPARRRPLPGIGIHHVSDPAVTTPDPRTPKPSPPPRPRQT